ncbi:MAG: transporter, family, 4-hydroxybenzoate transporter [Methylobacteriaceae bacterium]|jgi:AAHS family 4-hydroxybenzoate transporter-like MFS transporter|nr:transporter, family, 4-hydroxybenzoate transporter [Methylobacteriaceae bacterium]
MAANVDVTRLIDEQRISRFQIMVAGLCGAVVFMDGFDAQAIGYVAPTLSAAWKLPKGALGPVFGAGLFGLMLGALILGPVADRIGRKPVIVVSVLWFGICTLLTVTADSLNSLLVWRLLTGLGLGGAMPNAIALTSEYSPQRSRATMVMVMFMGFSLGSAIGGLIAAQFISKYGWTSVFWLGGMVPIVLAPVLFLVLPESVRLLALRGSEDQRIRGFIKRINPDLRLEEAHFVISEEHPRGFTVKHLFTEGRAPATLLFWVMFFMNLLDIYFLAAWLPTVINNAGLSIELAVVTSTMLQVGGTIGVLVLSRFLDRGNPYFVLGATYFSAAIFIAAIGSGGASIALLIPAVFAAGFCVVGAQTGSNALVSIFYPTFIRSTGVGWALGIGRIGSIIGPVLGGFMLSAEWHIPTIFLVGAIPVLIASCAVMVLSRLGSSKKHLRERALGRTIVSH